MMRLGVWALLIFTTACGGGSSRGGEDCRDCNWNPPPGELVLGIGAQEGQDVSFEFVAPDLVAAELILKNVGELDLRISGTEVEGGIHATTGKVGFAVPVPAELVIPREGTSTIPVRFTPPSSGVTFGRIRFLTDGLRDPLLTLTGKVERQVFTECLKSSAAVISSEGEATCEGEPQQIALQNSCADPVRITALEVIETPLVGDDDPICPNCADFAFQSWPTLPYVIAPGGALNLSYRYSPRGEGEDRAKLEVSFEAGDSAAGHEVLLEGSATAFTGACGAG